MLLGYANFCSAIPLPVLWCTPYRSPSPQNLPYYIAWLLSSLLLSIPQKKFPLQHLVIEGLALGSVEHSGTWVGQHEDEAAEGPTVHSSREGVHTLSVQIAKEGFGLQQRKFHPVPAVGEKILICETLITR